MIAEHIVKKVHRFDHTARLMHDALRVSVVTGNRGAAELARENRDIARRMHLSAYADALEAGWLPS